MSNKTPLYHVPVPSTEFIHEATLDESGPSIRYDFYRDNAAYRGGICFVGAVAVQKTREPICTVWQIEECYDTLVEVASSSWAEERFGRRRDESKAQTRLRHFMIYLDSVGCLEVLAENWQLLPEQSGAWA
ncbi:MAG: hypothetical protein ABSH20_10340 [Tepidisphaeraceae bacterium]|jgi:hypothetical protein